MVRYLVEQGTNKEKANNAGITALIAAADRGQLEVVRYLVERGADKDKAMNDGATALFKAASGSHFQVVRYLVEQGADVNKARYNGTTALWVAEHAEMVGYLLWAGATPPLFQHVDVPTNL